MIQLPYVIGALELAGGAVAVVGVAGGAVLLVRGVPTVPPSITHSLATDTMAAVTPELCAVTLTELCNKDDWKMTK